MEDVYKSCSFYELISHLKDLIFNLMFCQDRGESWRTLDTLCSIKMILDDAMDLYDKQGYEINDLTRQIESLEKRLRESRGD